MVLTKEDLMIRQPARQSVSACGIGEHGTWLDLTSLRLLLLDPSAVGRREDESSMIFFLRHRSATFDVVY